MTGYPEDDVDRPAYAPVVSVVGSALVVLLALVVVLVLVVTR